jgi:hypothetical protein
MLLRRCCFLFIVRRSNTANSGIARLCGLLALRQAFLCEQRDHLKKFASDAAVAVRWRSIT